MTLLDNLKQHDDQVPFSIVAMNPFYNMEIKNSRFTSIHATLMHMVPVTEYFDYYYIKERSFSWKLIPKILCSGMNGTYRMMRKEWVGEDIVLLEKNVVLKEPEQFFKKI